MTTPVAIRFVEKFPEPAFADLQREVFAPLERMSPEFAAVARGERSATGPIRSALLAPMVRVGAFAGEQLVGWSYGWFERGGRFYMANSGVVASHRRLGLYSQLTSAIVEHAQSQGAVAVHSQHSVLNAPVIIAKLKLGFVISGTDYSEQFGLLVQLVRHTSGDRAAIFRERVVPVREPHDI